MSFLQTLIELYDERPIENVLASEVFRPTRTVFLCPREIAQHKKVKDALARYFRHCGLDTELVFLESSFYYADKVARQLRSVVETYPDCVVDITGGTDAALFACGVVSAELGIPAFTYSRRNNCFYNIQSAPFADQLPCTVRHSVEDCFLMAGGALRPGRVDNAILDRYADRFEPFFRLYLAHRAEWTRAVNYIQVVSQSEHGTAPKLTVNADFTVKGERGTRVDAPVELLGELEGIGFLRNVSISEERVSFTFRDAQVRAWLRDIGSVLELYLYKQCIDAGLFNDVVTSAVVDWESTVHRDGVTNEIDVMAMRGLLPVFISCKTCPITTEALNELAILRDRFGGKGAKAAIVTTQRCRSVTLNRASELGIDVIDLDDLKNGSVRERLVNLLREEK